MMDGYANRNATLRRIDHGDISNVGSLIRKTILDCYTDVYPPLAVDYFLRYHQDSSIEKRASCGVVLVAEVEGEIAGTGSLVGDEISGVFVRSRYQGNGVGNLVMDELEARGRRAGLDEVTLSISLSSRGFYKGRGYEILREAEIDLGMGQALVYWVGRKRLG